MNESEFHQMVKRFATSSTLAKLFQGLLFIDTILVTKIRPSRPRQLTSSCTSFVRFWTQDPSRWTVIFLRVRERRVPTAPQVEDEVVLTTTLLNLSTVQGQETSRSFNLVLPVNKPSLIVRVRST